MHTHPEFHVRSDGSTLYVHMVKKKKLHESPMNNKLNITVVSQGLVSVFRDYHNVFDSRK